VISGVFKIIRKVIGYGLLVMLVWTLAPDGLANRYVYDQHPQRIERYNNQSTTAFVFFTGVQSSGETHSAPLRDIWGKKRDVIVVEYNRERFDGPVTAYDTYTLLVDSGYKRVILDGSSMGGLLATDVIDFAQAADSKIEFAVMMQDVPQTEEDLYDRDNAVNVATFLYPGPVTNWWATDLFWHFGFNPPARYMLGQGVNDAQLQAHYEASRSYPLSGWAGEIRFIVNHREYGRNQYVGIPLIYMQSEKDSVVKPTADKWKSVFGNITVINVPETTHVGFVEYPAVWRKAFEKGFASLPPGW
jgi:pimeloyl-ACP methyl ester carboxylesterase